MKKTFSSMIMLMLVFVLVITGCGANKNSNENTSQPSSSGAAEASGTSSAAPETSADGPITVNKDLPDSEIQGSGPGGEKAVSAKTLELTPDEVKKIKEGKFTAAIAMHSTGNDWSAAQVKNLKETFAKMGVEVVAVTDAQQKPEKLVTDIETILAMKPDILVSLPLDPVSTVQVYKKAVAAGVKLVFMDSAPNELKAGTDYVSVVSADNYGNGVAAAHIMGDVLGKKGKIGVIYYAGDLFVTNQRRDAFIKTITEEYPDIEILAKSGTPDSNEAEKIASGMLTKYPDMDGMFVVWDASAEGAMAAARNNGRNDLKIVTIDLGANVALSMAEGGMIKGLGAQLPSDQGIAEAILGGYALIGKEAPAFVALPALPVTKENVLDAWKTIYHVDAPAEIQAAAKK
jgi:ribose transport system substrate-binding protein